MASKHPRVLTELKNFLVWVRNNPATCALLALLVATLVYFYGGVPLFVKGTFSKGVTSTAGWAWQAWNPQMNQEHSKLVPLIAIGLVWYHRRKIAAAPKVGSNHGIIFIAIGLVLFLLGARCLQPRFALASLPFIIYGSVLFIWGRQVARIVLFPCAFLVFMIPVAAIEQATFRLQFLSTGVVGFLSNIFGIKMHALGTTLIPDDSSFNFQVAEGCSGIRSLTAMTMVTAIYVHLTQDRLWKKVTILVFSIAFAIIGNIGRIFTVILVARLISPDVASGIYHEYSGFVFFPIALIAMWLFAKLINLRWGELSMVREPLRQEQVKYDY